MYIISMKRIIYALIIFTLTGCQGQVANGKTQETISHEIASSSTSQATDEAFPFPQIPSTLRTPEARKDYLLRNYWTCFDFTNQVLLENRNVTEQGLVNFVALLADGQTDKELTDASMQAL